MDNPRSQTSISVLIVVLLTVQTVLIVLALVRLDRLLDSAGEGHGHDSAQAITAKPPFVEGVEAGSNAVLGAPEAPVQIVEFSDFTCSACAKAAPTIKTLVSKLGDKVSVSYRFFPLSPEGPSIETAAAASCAGDQAAFWPMHDALFAHQGKPLDRETMVGLAEDLGLNPEPFRACLEDDETAMRIASDEAAGTSYQVDSTPTFFVNGHRIVGSASLSTFEKTIAKALGP